MFYLFLGVLIAALLRTKRGNKMRFESTVWGSTLKSLLEMQRTWHILPSSSTSANKLKVATLDIIMIQKVWDIICCYHTIGLNSERHLST